MLLNACSTLGGNVFDVVGPVPGASMVGKPVADSTGSSMTGCANQLQTQQAFCLHRRQSFLR